LRPAFQVLPENVLPENVLSENRIEVEECSGAHGVVREIN
jgi:hypothetical protein